ncbi:MAG: hypothetical protein GEU75_03535 [Dehalococcoidia bacterium]|nr:hypothetical protein [Dehalococcoidia bacterium]
MTSPADLFALQELDLKHDARRALIADIESRLAETEALIAARETVAEATAALDGLRRQQHDLDIKLTDLDAKIKPLEERLYGGSVRNPKELTDLQKEDEGLKARRRVLDDEALSLIETVEAATGALNAAQGGLRRTEIDWQADQERLRADQTQAQQESARLQEERSLRTQGMDRSALGLYENLRKAKQGRGVARIERTTCQGCRVSLPTHVVQRVRTGATLVQCPRCERILVGS